MVEYPQGITTTSAYSPTSPPTRPGCPLSSHPTSSIHLALLLSLRCTLILSFGTRKASGRLPHWGCHPSNAFGPGPIPPCASATQQRPRSRATGDPHYRGEERRKKPALSPLSPLCGERGWG